MIDWRELSIEIDRRIVGVESAQVYAMRRRGTLGRSSLTTGQDYVET